MRRVRAERLTAIRLAQQESRIAHLPAAERKEEKALLKLDESIAEAIVKGMDLHLIDARV